VARRSAEVARLTGLDPALVARRYGRLSRAAFDQGRGGTAVGSPYDGTLMAASPDPANPWLAAPDPITDGLGAPVVSAMMELYRRLGWQPPGAYRLGNDSAARQWDWGRGRQGPQAMTALRGALAADPKLRLLVVHGLFDTVTPYFRTKLLLAQIPPSLAGERVRLLVLPGGHMIYIRPGPRAALRAAAAEVFAP
jgi:carboxypeptidase C (cathepsin A)